MSYWPGELVQTLSINGNVLSINPGNSVVLPGGGSGSNWSQFPAQQVVDLSNYGLSNVTVIDASTQLSVAVGLSPVITATASNIAFNVDAYAFKGIFNTVSTTNSFANNAFIRNGSISTLSVSSFNGGTTINASSINASSITANTFVALSTIEVTNVVSSSVVSADALINISSINGQPLSTLGVPTDWSLFPALSTVNMAGNNIGDINNPSSLAQNIYANNLIGSAKLDNLGNPLAIANYTTQGAVGNNLAGQRLIAYTSSTGTNLQTTDNVFQNGMEYVKTFEIDNVPYAVLLASSTLGGWQLTDRAGNDYTMANGFTTSNIFIDLASISSLATSSINGIEFTGGGGGSITLSTITSAAFSTIGASIQQGLMSSIVFNPQVNIDFNVDLGLGGLAGGLAAIGGGLFAIAVGVPTTAGTITYGLIKGIASLFEPRPINNISNTTFETFNFASQLQISTLNQQVSTITRLVSTIPSTILVNDNPTFSTISTCDVEVLVSTLSPLPPFTAIRALGDPVQIVSSPWSVYQSVNDWSWVPLPSGGGNVSSVSSLVVNGDLTILPSTILRSETAGAGMYVLNNDGVNTEQVFASGFTVQDTVPGTVEGTFTANTGTPIFLDNNFSTFQIQLAGQSIQIPQKNVNNSTITNVFMTNAPGSEPALTYALYPPGFPSTTCGQILFQSSINGGLGGVQINSQLGAAKSLAVTSGGVYASDIVTGSNSDYPLLVQVPDLDQWVLLGMSTMGSGGVGKSEIINTTSTNTGQLVIAAPNLSTNSSVRVLTLDSSAIACGINNPNPVATLDVGLGLNYPSVGSIGAFAANRNGTLEVTIQNQNTGCNASAYFFAVENTGTDYAGFGQNSLNLSSIYDTFLELPGASVMSGTLDCVIGPQSDHSSNSGIYLTYQDGSNAVLINSNGSVSWNASYSGAVVNQGNFGTPGSVLITNGGSAPPDWGNSINMNIVGASTLNANVINTSSVMTFGFADFQNRDIIDVNVAGVAYDVMNVDVVVAPSTDRVLNFNVPGAADYVMTMRETGSNVGIGKVPADGVKLDVAGLIAASNVSTTQLSASSATISSITQPIALTAAPQAGTCLTAGFNFDLYTSPYFGVFNGKQIVHGGYFGTTDSSLGGGKGQFSFAYPVPLSSLMTFQATYFTNSTSPGLNSIPWVGNGTPDAFGRASTIQVYGDSGRDLLCYFLGII